MDIIKKTKINIDFYLLFLLLILFSCSSKNEDYKQESLESSVSLVILGTIQDAGSPQIGCKKECCIGLIEKPDHTRKVVSIGVIDEENNQSYLFEATPDIGDQIGYLNKFSNQENLVDGIFITHAHIGHYTGLQFLGKEAIDAKKINVFAMPTLTNFLKTNGPWSQLVKRDNIVIQPLQHNEPIVLSDQLSVQPFLVPHRDEFSETVGYKIIGPNKSALFIPDIDKWQKWTTDIIKEIQSVDYAFLDATFYDSEELNNRDMKEIPHPFVVESMELFNDLSKDEKNKIYFIHFNHTNPLIDENSKAYQTVINSGFNVASFLDKLEL